ncbi:MAG: hypothetical protein IPM78_11905 [Moraxellaceae bacterium]|nr:hypothetical protein [Moraxellaceae bacterium]
MALEELSDYTQEAQKTWKQLVRSYRIEDARILPLVTMTANDNWLTFYLCVMWLIITIDELLKTIYYTLA